MAFADPEPWKGIARTAYSSGRWIRSDALALPTDDLALTQGVCAVERIRSYSGQLFRAPSHLNRWRATVDALKIPRCPIDHELMLIIEELIALNPRWIDATDDFGVVVIGSPGRGDGMPSVIVDLYAIDQEMIRERIANGTPLVVTSVVQPPNESWPRSLKVRSRLHYYLADMQARERVPDALGLLLDQDGTITETSIANVLLVEGSTVVCPETDQILRGVSLAAVNELVDDAGLTWSEQRIEPARLVAADEVLLTGTSCGIWFANSIDGADPRPPGRIYAKLRSAFEGLVKRG